MQTDIGIYQYLAMGTRALQVITGGIIVQGQYRFASVTLKNLERRIDALFEPDGHAGPVYVVEFQAQQKRAAWYNLMVKVGLYGENHPDQEVLGIMIVPRASPKRSKGSKQIAQSFEQLTKIYLGDFLPTLLRENSNDPFVAVLAPLVLEDQELQQVAPQLWHNIDNSDIAVEIQDNLKQILEFWLLERFKHLTIEDIAAMFPTLTPLEKTRGYKDIFARGRSAGIAEGRAEGRAELLKRQITRRFGALPEWAKERIDASDSEQLELWAEQIFDAQSVEELLR
ncbi:hypothetical protein TI04_10110 [Achromatium sp. WMS2]|nr:hypothetical protein TI04_10110 [Achromatium sp. WMS2]